MADLSTPITERQRLESLKAALWRDRSSWIDHWREISELQQPRLGRFLVTDSNQGKKRHNKIHDNTAIFASRTLAAGLMSGMTSPARPWFKLEIADKDLMEAPQVKTWLHDTAGVLRRVFASSNTYRALHSMYEELGLFGTSADVVLPDFENVVHHFPLTVGEYAIATDDMGRPATLARELQMTVGQMVSMFGLEKCSSSVRNLHARHAIFERVTVYHVIEKREKRGRGPGAKDMPWASVYFEPGRDDAGVGKFLRESGFKRNPLLAPRWVVTGNDTYGQSPGMECLGDVKQLQHQQLRKAQAIDYQVNPPLQVPTAYKEQQTNRLPGGIMFVDAAGPGGGVRTAFDVNLRLDYLLEDIRDVRERIRTAYYADLFLMLAQAPANGRMTATEVAERHEEKLLMLGPVLERLHNELLSPLIDLTFDRCMDAGILPPPPQKLEGADINVEFVSVLAQAQRAVAAQGTDRLLGAVTTIAQLWPEARHKIDAMQVVDEYADMYGVSPRIVVADDQAVASAQAEAQAAQAAQLAAAAQPVAAAAKSASEVDADNMQSVMNMFAGYGSPSPQEV